MGKSFDTSITDKVICDDRSILEDPSYILDETRAVYLQHKYFLVRDVSPAMDRLDSMSRYQAPNVRQGGEEYPVYGMGQPTKDGLTIIIQSLKADGYQVRVSA